jgi:hypothetical protein
MGIYSINCPNCNKEFQWFSGNVANQLCPDCSGLNAIKAQMNCDIEKVNNMDYEQLHLDSLNRVIAIQNEFIAYLKAEVERLRAPQINLTPPTYPQYPSYPIGPYGGAGTSAPQPLQPPFIVTCGDPGPIASGGTTNQALTGVPLPYGSIQSGAGGAGGSIIHSDDPSTWDKVQGG